MPAVHFIEVEGGRIVYNAKKNDLIAECRSPGHEKCRKHRTCKPGVREQQGRPIGFLAAWLKRRAGFHTHVTHLQVGWISKEDRDAARAAFEAMGPDALALLQYERPLRPGEGREPDVCL